MSESSDKTSIDHETEVSPPSRSLNQKEVAAALLVARQQTQKAWHPLNPISITIKRSSGDLEKWILVGQSEDGRKFVSQNADGSLLHYDDRAKLSSLNPNVQLPIATVSNLSTNVKRLLGEVHPDQDK